MSSRNLRIFTVLGALLLGLAFAGSASAKDASLSWTLPIAYESGEALPASEIASFKVDYGTCSAPNVFGTSMGVVTVTGAATAATVTGFSSGTFCFRVATVATNGEQSVWTDAVSIVFSKGKPKPPTNVRVILLNGGF
jgi:hypothetical protein